MGILVGLYLAGLVFSLALSVALWRKDRSQLNVDLCAVWVAGTTSAVIQGGVGVNRGALVSTLGFSSTVLTSLALANLTARLTGQVLPWRGYLAFYGVGIGGAIIAASVGAPFWAVALPVAITAPFSAADMGIRALRSSSESLGTMGHAFILACIAFVAHNLDYPFLANKPEFAPIGFAFALFLVWALAPTGMAVVLERTAEERGRLAEVEAQKSRFFANISHELRTPLTLILGPVQQLVAGETSQDRQQLLGLVQRNAQRLLRLIEDLLDLSRAEAGSLKLQVARVDIAGLVRRVAELAAEAAREKSLSFEYPTDVEASYLSGDPHRLEIVLSNLVSNAIKYTPAGGHVHVEMTGDDEGVRVIVSDDGPGIEKSDQARIFQRFVRVQDSHAVPGTGIGLSLARELAEAHGGSLTVESEPGSGSRFILTLPREAEPSAAQAPRPTQSQPTVSTGQRARSELDTTDTGTDGVLEEAAVDTPICLEGGRVPQILIVEDEPDMRDFLVEVVSEQFECRTARDGQEALALLETFRPDLIVTDVMMPRVSGQQLCRHLKRDRSLRTIPVVMLTARSGVEAALEGYGAGADDFISKPFHPRVLVAHIRSHLIMRQLGMQLADQARLATAGSLAAGVAHEVRNPLNGLINAAEALGDPNVMVPQEELLKVVRDGAARIQTVVDALTVHVSPADGLDARPCDVRESVDATLRLLQHRAGGIEVDVDMPEDVEVMVPTRSFNQALLNLLDNALRAASTWIGVRVTVGAETVRLVVEDDGSGVVPEHRSRLFDPFFTTRDVGDGSGLGLHLSRKLVRDAGGELWFEPRPEGGARFVLELPRLGARSALAS